MSIREKRLRKARNDVSRLEAQREAAIKTLVRVETQLPGLKRSIKRLVASLLAEPKPKPVHPANIETAMLHGKTQTMGVVVDVQPPKDDGLDLPTWLDRRGMAPADDLARTAVLAEVEAEKKRKAEIAAEKRKIKKEHIEAELTGKRRKMPLTGKAALEALK